MSTECIFNIMTIKGSKGSTTLNIADSTVQDLYDQARSIVGWSIEEDDYYVLILAGKKLVDLTVPLSNFKLGVKSQVVATKVNKPVAKITKASISAAATAAVEASTPTPNTMSDEPNTIPVSPTTTTTETKTTQPPTSPVPPNQIAAAAASDQPQPTSPAPASIPTDFDFNSIPDVDFTDAFNPTNSKVFMEAMGQINPDLAKEIDKNSGMVWLALQLLSRRHHNGVDKVDLNDIVPKLDAQLPSLETAARSVSTGGGAPADVEAVRRAHQNRQAAQIEQQLSEKDKQAIERLQELGFSKMKATQAYLVCDKNEEIAANYLFENMD